ncbi:MAG: DNA polymerase I, partial [Planctomycetales bacterium]|nr:DNA polymerase I [Planctomycetales bacterium]
MADKNRQLALHGFDAAGPPPRPSAAGSAAAGPADDPTPQADPPELKGKSVYAIDAHSLIFQVFHAIRSELTSPAGEPVAAVHGFARDILSIIEKKKPDYLLCAFDLPGATFRHEIYEDYKADRGEMPDELRVQLPVIRQMLQSLGIPVLEYENHEADDVLATVARICDQSGAECYVVTGDKDCRQLITDHVKIYNIRKDAVFDRAALAAEWGIRPEQVVDFQALVGDPTDNVPGVPLIGPKFAQQLLAQYGTLEEVLDHADQVSGARRQQNLRQGRSVALLSRQLVRLVDNLPLPIDWSAARLNLTDAPA